VAETIEIAEWMVRELELIEAMEAANLPAALDQDVRDLCRLIQEKTEYPDFPNLRLDLLQSLNRLVQAARQSESPLTPSAGARPGSR
jgi:hypothetical protein